MKRREIMTLGYPQNLYTLIFRHIIWGEYVDPYPKELIPPPAKVDKMMEYIDEMLGQPDRKKLAIFLKYVKGQSMTDIAKEYNVSSSAIRNKIDHVEMVLRCGTPTKFILENGVTAHKAKIRKAKKELANRLSNPETRVDSFNEIDIRDVGFSTRSRHTLGQNHIRTVGDITNYKPSEIRKLRNIGNIVYTEIITVLQQKFDITADLENDRWIIFKE